MQCDRCGTQNRPDARFCRQCGAPLSAARVEAPSPAAGANVCAHCGAALRPDARFCATCGQPVAASQAPPPSYAPSPARDDVDAHAVPLSDSTAWGGQNDGRVARAGGRDSSAAPGYAAPSYPPMPLPPPPADARRGIPRWLWFVAGAALIIFLAVIAARVFLLFGSLDGDSTTDTAPPLVVKISTEDIALEASSNPVEVGEHLGVTVTFTNTQDVAVQSVRVYLDETGEPALSPVGETAIPVDHAIAPSTSETWTFTLDAISAGDGPIAASVSAEVATDPPSPALWRIGPLTVTVEP